jgi:hypothetical protein
MWTTGVFAEDALPKRPRTDGVGKGKGAAKAPKAAPKSKGRGGGRVNATALAAAIGPDSPNPPNVPIFNFSLPSPPAPQPKIARGTVRKTIVKKVPIDAGEKDATLKRGKARKQISP